MGRYRYIDEKDAEGKEQHLHMLDGKPLIGTSGVVNVLAKPLTWWAAGLAVAEFGWTNSKDTSKEDRRLAAYKALEAVRDLSTEEYLQKLDRAYRAHNSVKDKAATKGTNMHSALESYVKDCIVSGVGYLEVANATPKPVQIFAEWAKGNVKQFLWSEMYTYSERMWVGGISDCGALLNDGNIALIDFKSSKEAYDSQFMQIAGYDLQVTETGGVTQDGVPIFTLPSPITCYVVFPFGAEAPEAVVKYEVEKYKSGFEACLTLHKILNVK